MKTEKMSRLCRPAKYAVAALSLSIAPPSNGEIRCNADSGPEFEQLCLQTAEEICDKVGEYLPNACESSTIVTTVAEDKTTRTSYQPYCLTGVICKRSVIRWNPRETGRCESPIVALAHELMHAEEFFTSRPVIDGFDTTRVGIPGGHCTVIRAEVRPIQMDNLFLQRCPEGCCPRLKHKQCFSPNPFALVETPYCGNGIVEEGEQCDPGIGTEDFPNLIPPADNGGLSCGPVGSTKACKFTNFGECFVEGALCKDASIGGAQGWCTRTIEDDLVCHTDNRIFCFQYDAENCDSSDVCAGKANGDPKRSRCMDRGTSGCGHKNPGFCSWFIHDIEAPAVCSPRFFTPVDGE